MNERVFMLWGIIQQFPSRQAKLKAAMDCIYFLEEEHKMRWATCAFLHGLMDKDCALSWSDREGDSHEARMNYEARKLERVASVLPPMRALKESLSEKQK